LPVLHPLIPFYLAGAALIVAIVALAIVLIR
jgi:hypothetical protein